MRMASKWFLVGAMVVGLLGGTGGTAAAEPNNQSPAETVVVGLLGPGICC